VYVIASGLLLHVAIPPMLKSVQFIGVPAQHPNEGLHVSVPLQYCPSLQRLLFGVWSQVSVASLQESEVQFMLSEQFGGVPAWQV
jgi:hypothetical protein